MLNDASTILIPPEILSEETILALGREVLESTESWKVGKTYAKGTVQTLSHHTNGDATFDKFWSKLGVNKAENENEFISAIKKVTLVKRILDTQSIWTMYYTFPPPVSPRVFTVLQTIYLDESSPRTGYDLLDPPLRRPSSNAKYSVW
ncbi:hypothetical protein AZE42_12340 [Rhizopogon vesiculosus]|uniref:DUF3074 domain-containing protein n=1 Tax=Rhizopogon vesiculosus TaxID=180088 RepID=A0A1J8QV54_9AGAM|nr:hypothetical protein AZE42_12340 [Rhizopogon vesiculosus]